MKLSIDDIILSTGYVINDKFPEIVNIVDERQSTIREWQNKVIKLLPDYKKKLASTIGKPDKENQLVLLNYLKLLSVYYLADFLCKKLSAFFDSNLSDKLKIDQKLKDIRGGVFEFIDNFNMKIDDLLEDDATGFIRMHKIIGGFNSSNNETINELYGEIGDFSVINDKSYSNIVEIIISMGMCDSLFRMATKCTDPTTNTICNFKQMWE